MRFDRAERRRAVAFLRSKGFAVSGTNDEKVTILLAKTYAILDERAGKLDAIQPQNVEVDRAVQDKGNNEGIILPSVHGNDEGSKQDGNRQGMVESGS